MLRLLRSVCYQQQEPITVIWLSMVVVLVEEMDARCARGMIKDSSPREDDEREILALHVWDKDCCRLLGSDWFGWCCGG